MTHAEAARELARFVEDHSIIDDEIVSISTLSHGIQVSGKEWKRILGTGMMVNVKMTNDGHGSGYIGDIRICSVLC